MSPFGGGFWNIIHQGIDKNHHHGIAGGVLLYRYALGSVLWRLTGWCLVMSK